MGMGFALQPGFVRWAPASQNHFNHCLEPYAPTLHPITANKFCKDWWQQMTGNFFQIPLCSPTLGAGPKGRGGKMWSHFVCSYSLTEANTDVRAVYSRGLVTCATLCIGLCRGVVSVCLSACLPRSAALRLNG